MSSAPMKLYPPDWYGIKNTAAPGVKYNRRQCAGETNHGFGNRRQCKNKPGHGDRGLFCESHIHLKARPEVPSESNRATQLFCELEQVKKVANDLAEHNRRLTGELEACCDVADYYKDLLEQVGVILGVPAEPHQGRDFLIVERVRELARGTTISNRTIMTTAGIEALTRAAQETLIEPTNDIS